MKGTIEKVWENKSRTGQKYLTLSIDGERYSLWDEKYFDQIHEGEVIDFDWKKSGNFKNITKVTPIDEENIYANKRLDRIIKMSCLKSASEILSSSKVELNKKADMAIEVARKFEKYIKEDHINENNAKLKKQSG
jgi:hypothetical protein